jgi:uncharacterized membrane protein (DUF485 family)
MANVAGRGKLSSPQNGELSAEDLEKEHFYEVVENQPEFQQLQKAKLGFIIPATIFFIVYYFTLPVLVGLFPKEMDTRVLGNTSIAYLFALSQFFMAWILAFMYLSIASKVFDPLIVKIVEQARKLRVQRGV